MMVKYDSFLEGIYLDGLFHGVLFTVLAVAGLALACFLIDGCLQSVRPPQPQETPPCESRP